MNFLFYIIFAEFLICDKLHFRFIGVSVNRYSSVKDTNELFSEACYEKCMQFLREDHQVLVFVHSRNGTSRSAQYFLNAAANKGHQELLLPSNITSGAYLAARKQMKAARCEELNQFFDCGMGIHHGGLIRSDRNLMERMFAGGHIRVMFCTATLAWGVNLPAHAVIIQVCADSMRIALFFLPSCSNS